MSTSLVFILRGSWAFGWPDSTGEWIALIVLALVVPAAALYAGKRMKRRKKP